MAVEIAHGSDNRISMYECNDGRMVFKGQMFIRPFTVVSVYLSCRNVCLHLTQLLFQMLDTAGNLLTDICKVFRIIRCAEHCHIIQSVCAGMGMNCTDNDMIIFNCEYFLYLIFYNCRFFSTQCDDINTDKE